MKKSQLLSVLLLASALTLAGCNSGSDTSSTSSSSTAPTSQPTSSTTAADKEEESIEVNAPAKVSFHGTVNLDDYVSVVYDDGSKDKAYTASIDQSKTTAEVSLAGHVLTLGGEGSITVNIASKTFEATFKTTAESAVKKQITAELSELTDYAIIDTSDFTFMAYHNSRYEFFRTDEHEFTGTAVFKSGLAYDGVFQEDPDTGAYSAPVFESAESVLYDQELPILFDELVPAYEEQAQMEYVILPADVESESYYFDSNVEEVFYYATNYQLANVLPLGAEIGDLWIARQENEGIVAYALAFNYSVAEQSGMLSLIAVGGQMAVLANVATAIEGDDPEEEAFPYDLLSEYYGFAITDELPEFSGVSYFYDEEDDPDYYIVASMKSNASATSVAAEIQAALAASEDFTPYMQFSETVIQYQANTDRYLVYVYPYTSYGANEVVFAFAPVPLEPTDNFPMDAMASVFGRVFTDIMPEVDGKKASLAYTPDASYMPTFYVDVQYEEEPASSEALAALVAAYGTKLTSEAGFTLSGNYYFSEHLEYRVSLGTYGSRLLIAINVLDKTMAAAEATIEELVGAPISDHLPEVPNISYYYGGVGDGFANIYAYLTTETAADIVTDYIAGLVEAGFKAYSSLSNGAVLYLSPNNQYQVAVFASTNSIIRFYFVPAPVVSHTFPTLGLLDWLRTALKDPSYDYGGSIPVAPAGSATYYFEDQGDYAYIKIVFDEAPEGGIDAAIAAFNAAQAEAGFVQYGSTKWYDSAD